jgi:hypothetical protein
MNTWMIELALGVSAIVLLLIAGILLGIKEQNKTMIDVLTQINDREQIKFNARIDRISSGLFDD